jgi:hypothetical protein
MFNEVVDRVTALGEKQDGDVEGSKGQRERERERERGVRTLSKCTVHGTILAGTLGIVTLCRPLLVGTDQRNFEAFVAFFGEPVKRN